MLKNVIFDWGGVLHAYKPDDIVKHFCEDDADCAILKEAVYHGWESLDAGTADYDAYILETLRILPERLHANALALFRRWYWVCPPIEDNWALIGRLKARGYRVYLLSNAPVYFAEHLDAFCPIVRLFEGRVVSGPIRMLKPGAEIYSHALSKFGIKAEETLFIDDNPDNAEGARRCGMYGFAYAGDTAALEAYIEELSR